MDRDAALVTALGAAVLAGCTRHRTVTPPSPSPTSDTPAPLAPDAAMLAGWWESEQRLVRLSGSVAGAAALRANHVTRSNAVAARLRVLGGVLPAPSLPAPLTGPAAGRVRALAAAERAAATAYVAALPRVTDPDVAVLGAELAAGARQHATVLGLLAAG